MAGGVFVTTNLISGLDTLLSDNSLDCDILNCNISFYYSTDYSSDISEDISLFSEGVSDDEASSDAELMDDTNLYYGDYQYCILDDGTIEITSYKKGTDTELEIPSTIDGRKVTVIGDDAFDNYAGIDENNNKSYWGYDFTSIIIPDTVTTIGSNAFMCCNSLISITIPNSVTSIDSTAFSDCSSLTSINVASGNKYYASYDGVLYSYDMTELICCPAGKTSIKISSGVTSIGNSAFWGCTKLKRITIPDSVTSLGEFAFSGCSSLKNITIPNGIENISFGTFYECSSLTSIVIPDSVTYISYVVFYECSNLTDIYYTGSKKQWNAILFGESWNEGCPSDTTIHYNSVVKGSTVTVGNYKYKVTRVSTGSNGTVTLTKVVTKTTSIKIPSTITISGNKYKVTAIEKNAFKGNTEMTSLVIGKNVKTIGANAFYNCKNLTKITIKSKKLKTSNVGKYAFGKNKKNVTIKVPAAKLKAYKKMLYKRGVSKKAKIS